jgi:predicted glycosyltransferase
MKYLFFTNTPAQVHQYRRAVAALRERGHDVLVLARDYGCTEPLLDHYDLPYESYGKCGTYKFSLARELPKHVAGIVRRTRRFDPECVFGRGAFAALAGTVARSPVVLVDDSGNTDLDHAVSVPLVDAVLTPHTFEKDLGEKHYEFRGFKELAYLHPDEYERQSDVRDELGVGPDEEFAIVRLNAFGSHHDVGKAGFTPEKRRQLVETLSERATVFVSDEGGEMDLDRTAGRAFDLHPALLHDALAAASLLVADTQTMVTEAALLGTPAIRSNSFVGDDDMGNFVDLERAGIVYNLREFEAVLDAATDLLADEDADARWRNLRDQYLEDKVNLTEIVVEAAEQIDAAGEFDARTLERVDGLAPRNSARDAEDGLPFGAVRSDGGRDSESNEREGRADGPRTRESGGRR